MRVNELTFHTNIYLNVHVTINNEWLILVYNYCAENN